MPTVTIDDNSQLVAGFRFVTDCRRNIWEIGHTEKV